MPIPLVAAAISALAPTLAQQGLDLLSGVFRGAVTKGTEKVANLIQEKTGIELRDIAENRLTDEQWQLLHQFEREHQKDILAATVELDKNDVERERIAQADRANARAMQLETLAKGDRLTQWFVYFYATLITLGTFAFVGWAAFGHNYAVSPESKDIINTVTGFLLGVAVSAIVQYFFGSSAGSKSKEEKLNLQADDKP